MKRLFIVPLISVGILFGIAPDAIAQQFNTNPQPVRSVTDLPTLDEVETSSSQAADIAANPDEVEIIIEGSGSDSNFLGGLLNNVEVDSTRSLTGWTTDYVTLISAGDFNAGVLHQYVSHRDQGQEFHFRAKNGDFIQNWGGFVEVEF